MGSDKEPDASEREPRPIGTPELPRSLALDHEPAQRQQDGRKSDDRGFCQRFCDQLHKPKFVISLLTLGFLMIYTGATLRLVSLSRQTMIEMARARIGQTESMGMDPLPLAPNRPIWVKVTFKNTGPTSARNVHFAVGWLVDKDFPNEPDFGNAFAGGSAVMAKDVPLLAQHFLSQDGGKTRTMLSSADIEAIHAYPPTLKFFIYGRVTYDDGFDAARELTFCWRYDNDGPKPMFIVCDGFNTEK